jgi:hypothetical protein
MASVEYQVIPHRGNISILLEVGFRDVQSEPIWASQQLIQCLASCASEVQPTSTYGDQEGSYHVNTPHPWQVQSRKYGCVPGTTCERVADIMARGSNTRYVKGPSQSPIQPSSNSNVDNA